MDASGVSLSAMGFHSGYGLVVRRLGRNFPAR